MPPHPTWRLLPVAAPGVPNLLVSASFSDDSYTVHLSDLANVWVERMEKKPIQQRALIEDTSIDPCDGPDQLRKMLDLIRAAFEANDPEHSNTTLSMATEDDSDSLALHVTCILPEPLKPLRWPMHFKKCPQSNVATNLVLPLIQAHEARMREIDQLLASLKEKDGVITRLTDKMEATGIGLEHVFSALSGKRKVTRAAVEEKIKGLAPFSEAVFRTKSPKLHPVTQNADVTTVLEGVFGNGGLKHGAEMDLEVSPVLDDWWTKLGKGKPVTLSQRSSCQPSKSRSPSSAVEPNPDDDDDDFQIQVSQPLPVDDDETSDGEDAEPAVSSPRPKSSGARLGALGGRKAPSRSPAPERTPSKRPASKLTQSGSDSETASDASQDETKRAPSSSPAKHAPKAGRLGRIGGRSREETPPLESTKPLVSSPLRSPAPGDAGDESSQLPRRHKLGTIGRRAPEPYITAQEGSDDDRGRGKASLKKETPRETSQERADRKRAELQKNLEKRAAAGPAKKKRKF
ncbi:XRCC4-like factor-domain-containing protein [Podospora fimiseda]|uniref:Non-homologous end-joining factor 1 n=1 Tax=Podospora fimiseda TaxID=252190 RepID=A0AAN7BHM4_9PEZI|nr:XRCC4-like factor-domain-containing protein [Podospora fimiseda]